MEPAEPVLRWLGPEDAETVSDLAHRIYFDVYHYETRELVQAFLDEFQSPEAIRRQMSEGMHYACIMVDGTPSGYTAFGMVGGRMELSKLYILDGFRGRGIGSWVLDRVDVLAAEAGATSVFLEVNTRNSGAIALYERHGYASTGVTDYHRLVMEKPLVPKGAGL